MSKIHTPLPSVGKGGVLRLRVKLLRQKQMESWVDTPEKGTRWIPLGKGIRAIVDEDMFDYFNQWNWWPDAHGYAVRVKCGITIRMHSAVIVVPAGMECDHRDRNPLNNTRSNLRIGTHQQNQMNRGANNMESKTSKFKGVLFSKSRKLYRAYASKDWKSIHLGMFEKEIDAAKAYNKWSLENCGEFAYQNPV